MKRFVSLCVIGMVAWSASAATKMTTPRVITTDNNASCDISVSPAATLLLPFFEVDVTKSVSDAANTIFSIINTSRAPQTARVTIWTDYAHPAVWFNVYLTGFDVEPISLYDVLVDGKLPPVPATAPDACRAVAGDLPSSTAAQLRQMLTTGVVASSDCKVGGVHGLATGYVTIDLVNACSPVSPLEPVYYSQVLAYDNVLTGDYEDVHPDKGIGNFAGGSPLVHIKAIPNGGGTSTATPLPYTFYDRYTPAAAKRVDRRQPLPSSFMSRFIQGGTSALFTDFAFWREAASPGGCVATNATMPVATVVRFDEFENPTMTAIMPSSPATSSLSTASSAFPPLYGASLTGWMYIDLDNHTLTRPSQNWITVRMRAEGRYGVTYDAIALKNGCAPGSVVSSVPQMGAGK
ncbi:MAG TPA: hypothetical protein VGJ82_10145 [Thermoanaerobaculia bacterium]